MKLRDILGHKFGKLTAISKSVRIKGETFVTFRCDCGKTKLINKNYVLSKGVDNCGCTPKRHRDIKGQKFGKLTAIKRLETKGKITYWLLKCDCGKETKRSLDNIAYGTDNKSCGCLRIKTQYGSKKTNSYGYVLIYKPDHPNCIKKKRQYIAEHRVVMEEMIGRYLEPYETVHHKNGLRSDNRPENLELWATVQPKGARVKDLIEHARYILMLYGELLPEEKRAE